MLVKLEQCLFNVGSQGCPTEDYFNGVLHVNIRLTASAPCRVPSSCLPSNFSRKAASSQQPARANHHPAPNAWPWHNSSSGVTTTGGQQHSASHTTRPIDRHLPQPRHTTALFAPARDPPPPHRTPSPTYRAPRPLNIPIPPRNKASPSPHHRLRRSSHRRHRATYTHNHILLPTKWRRLPR